MYYKIAGLIVEMNPIYEPLISQVKEYVIMGIPEHIDCKIPQGEKSIERFLKKNPHLSLGDAEYLLYGAYFYDTLLDYNGVFLHSSCVVNEGLAYLFSAPSGTGKSTHTQLWLKAFPRSFILNDDKPALRLEDGKFVAYGTPFSGKTNLNKNESYPVAGIAFIKRDQENSIDKMETKDAITNFISQTMPLTEVKRIDQTMDMLNKIIEQIPIFELKCNMNLDAVKVSYEGMKPNKS